MAFGENGLYAVLINREGQHSLWPENVEVPKGWTLVKEPSPKAEATAFVETSWTDMAPASLRAGAPKRVA